MEALVYIIGGIFILYITGLLTTIRKSVGVADKGLDTFNDIGSRKLVEMDLESDYSHKTKLGKMANKIKEGKKTIATEAEVRDLLKGMKHEKADQE